MTMKTDCNFEHYFEGYFSGDLSASEQRDLQEHLSKCSICQDKIDRYYSVYIKLKSYHRPATPPSIKETYHTRIESDFNSGKFIHDVRLFIEKFFTGRTPVIRFAQFSTLVLIGVIIGWLLFAPVEPQIILRNSDPYNMARPISSVDMDYAYYYLLASEMVLLEIQNSTEQSDFYFNRELAQKLLIKTFRVHEIALKLNNLHLLNFLGRMELILHDVSNSKDEDISEALVTIKMVINEANLLPEVKSLQSVFKRTRDEIGA